MDLYFFTAFIAMHSGIALTAVVICDAAFEWLKKKGVLGKSIIKLPAFCYNLHIVNASDPLKCCLSRQCTRF